jgi:hypothetical protein
MMSAPVRLHEVVAADLFCGNWGLNPCITQCADCPKRALEAMAQLGIPDVPLWQDKTRREHDEHVVQAAERLVRETFR